MSSGKITNTVTILALFLMMGIMVLSGILSGPKRKYHRKSALLRPVTTLHAPAKYPVFGIDVSHYQGYINWEKVNNPEKSIKFVFIRATMGSSDKDNYFTYNWKNVKKAECIRGAYHYYRPYENSAKQFANFSRHVILEKGDAPPILDIEKTSMFGMDNLRRGILNWLRLAEEHYGVKPILYTGRKFYLTHLKGYVDDYTIWIASYSGEYKMKNIEWTFYQFTDRLRVPGISTYVDGNYFKKDLKHLQEICIK